MDSDQGPWPVLAGQATAGGKHLSVSCRPQAGRRPRPAETAALSEVALPLRRPDEPENRRGRRDRDQAREPLIVGGLVTGSARHGPSADRQRCRRRMAV